MTIEQGDDNILSKEQRVFDLSKRKYLYSLVTHTVISPRELGDDLVIRFDRPEPTTQEEKRKAKIEELDAYKKAYLQVYNESCEMGIDRFDLIYLMENGFGLGAADCFDDDYIDALITADEQIVQGRKRNSLGQ